MNEEMMQKHIQYLKSEVDRLTIKCDKQAAILQHAYPEKSGRFFICGAGGKLDKNHLPERIAICPAYGSDVTEIYVKMEK